MKFLALFSILIITSAASAAMACSPAKLAILKNRCEAAGNPMTKKAYCIQKQDPHSVKFVAEKNYNVE